MNHFNKNTIFIWEFCTCQNILNHDELQFLSKCLKISPSYIQNSRAMKSLIEPELILNKNGLPAEAKIFGPNNLKFLNQQIFSYFIWTSNYPGYTTYQNRYRPFTYKTYYKFPLLKILVEIFSFNSNNNLYLWSIYE